MKNKAIGAVRKKCKSVMIVMFCISSLLATGQKTQKVIITTPLNKQLKPLPSDRFSYAIEDRWLENGQWKAKAIYTETGTLMAEYGYADSTRKTLHGKYTLYGTNRKKKQEVTYNMGVADGPFAEWLADGTPVRKGNITGDNIWGNVELYNGEGKLEAIFTTNEKGMGSGKEFLPKTGITAEGAVKNGKQDGLWIYRDTAGKKIMEVLYNEKGIEKETCFDNAGKQIEGKECISDRPATFTGGEKAWISFLEKNLNYSKALRKQEIQGTVILKFLVKEDGSITSVKVVESPDPELSAEAIRVIKTSPKWTPAVEANITVPYTHIQGITFQLK